MTKGADGSGEKVVTVGTKPQVTAAGDLHGFMRGSVIVPPGLDLTAPTGGMRPRMRSWASCIGERGPATWRAEGRGWKHRREMPKSSVCANDPSAATK